MFILESRVLQLSGYKEENKGFWATKNPWVKGEGETNQAFSRAQDQTQLTNEVISAEKLPETGHPFGRCSAAT